MKTLQPPRPVQLGGSLAGAVRTASTQVRACAGGGDGSPGEGQGTGGGPLGESAGEEGAPAPRSPPGPRGSTWTGRLIVRRVKRLNPQADAGQDELFTTWRHHAVFVTSPFETQQAEGQHRDHAVVEQVIADAAGSALAHLPSGSFNANAAWAVLWAIAHNLTRAAGALAGMFHAHATTATIRAHLINVPARTARGARRLTLHLPDGWPWQAAWKGLHAAVHRQPFATA